MNDRRPLYLCGDSRLEVRLKTPALEVLATARAPVLYPLARLERIISRGRVRWSGGAIMGCIAHGVPVLFVDPDSRVVANLAVAGGSASSLDRHLATATLAPDWPHRLEYWCRSQERRLINHMLAAVRWTVDDRRAERMEELLQRALELRWGDATAGLLNVMQGMAQGVVDLRLAVHGVSSEVAHGGFDAPTIAEELYRLASWPMRGRLLALRGSAPLGPEDEIRLFRARLEQPLGRTIDRMIRYLWQIPL